MRSHKRYAFYVQIIDSEKMAEAVASERMATIILRRTMKGDANVARISAHRALFDAAVRYVRSLIYTFLIKDYSGFTISDAQGASRYGLATATVSAKAIPLCLICSAIALRGDVEGKICVQGRRRAFL